MPGENSCLPTHEDKASVDKSWIILGEDHTSNALQPAANPSSSSQCTRHQLGLGMGDPALLDTKLISSLSLIVPGEIVSGRDGGQVAVQEG